MLACRKASFHVMQSVSYNAVCIIQILLHRSSVTRKESNIQTEEKLLCSLPRIRHILVLPNPNLALPLIHHVLHKHFFGMRRLELADPARIPQLARNAQVLAAAHQRVRLAALGRRRDAVRVEVVLLAAGDRDQPILWSVLLSFFSRFAALARHSPSMAYQSILPRHRLGRNNALAPRHKPPAPRPKRPVEDPPVLDFGQIHNAVGLDLDVLRVGRFEEHGHDLRRKRLVADAVEAARPVDFFVGAGVAVGREVERFVGEAGARDAGRGGRAGEGLFDCFGSGRGCRCCFGCCWGGSCFGCCWGGTCFGGLLGGRRA
jgi:hypothetical protein